MSISASGVFVDSATDENVRDAAFKGEVNALSISIWKCRYH
jgi:predicted secreted protein